MRERRVRQFLIKSGIYKAYKQGPGDPIVRRTLIPNPTVTSTPSSPISAGSARWYGLTEMEGTSTTRNTFGWTVIADNASTRVAFQDGTGAYIEYGTTTGDGNEAGITTGQGTPTVQAQLLPDWTVTMKTGALAQDIASVRMWMGLSSNTLSGVDTSNAVNVAIFRYSTVAGDSNWKAVTANGVLMTVADTGIPVTLNTRYVLRVRFITSSTVEFSINGTVVLVTSTTPPGATAGMGAYAAITNKGAGTVRVWRFRRMYTDAN